MMALGEPATEEGQPPDTLTQLSSVIAHFSNCLRCNTEIFDGILHPFLVSALQSSYIRPPVSVKCTEGESLSENLRQSIVASRNNSPALKVDPIASESDNNSLHQNEEEASVHSDHVASIPEKLDNDNIEPEEINNTTELPEPADEVEDIEEVSSPSQEDQIEKETPTTAAEQCEGYQPLSPRKVTTNARNTTTLSFGHNPIHYKVCSVIVEDSYPALKI
eukprot:sb/3469860/